MTDPGVTGCSLKVLASGALPVPSGGEAVVSGPALVATNQGFVLGLRELATDSTSGSVRLYAMTDCGVPSENATVDLAANNLACAGQPAMDGLGAAYQAPSGLLAASLPNCGDGGGVLLIPFDADAALAGSPAGPRNLAFEKLELASPTGAVATGTTAPDYELFYRVETGSKANLQRVVISAPPGAAQGPAFKNVAVTHPLGPEPLPAGRVVSSSSLRAFISDAPTKGGVVVSIGDNASDSVDKKGEVLLPSAKWSAATAWGDQVGALVPTPGGAEFKVARLSGSTVSTVASGSLSSSSPIQGAALARLGDSLLLVTGADKSIKVQRHTGANSNVAQSPADIVSLDVDASILESFDGTHLAAAAARTRVAVAWLNKSAAPSGTPMGGWAILQCTPN